MNLIGHVRFTEGMICFLRAATLGFKHYRGFDASYHPMLPSNKGVQID